MEQQKDFLLPFLEDAFAWIEEVFGRVDISILELIVTIFLTIDFEKMNRFILRQISEKQKVVHCVCYGIFTYYRSGNKFDCIKADRDDRLYIQEENPCGKTYLKIVKSFYIE